MSISDVNKSCQSLLTRVLPTNPEGFMRPCSHCKTLKYTAIYAAAHCNIHCDTLQHTATHCHTLQHTATHCNTLQHTATRCNMLQHAATRCNTLQHAATRCNTQCLHCDHRVNIHGTFVSFIANSYSTFNSDGTLLQCVAVCCSVLQCVAVCCSVLQSTL